MSRDKETRRQGDKETGRLGGRFPSLWFAGLVVIGALSVIFMLGERLLAQSNAPAAGRDQIGVVRGQGAVLLDQQTLQPVNQIAAGALLLVKGRSQDSAFLLIQTENLEVGWVASSALLVINVSGLPVQPLPTAVAPQPGTPLTSTVSTEVAITTTLMAPVGNLTANNGQVIALVSLQESRLNLRAGPGLAYPVVAKADPGSQWLATGQDQSGAWVQLRPLTGGNPAWATTDYLRLSSPLVTLTVVTDVPPPPVAEARILVPTPVPGNPLPGNPPTSNTPATAPNSHPGKTGLSGVLVFQDRIGGAIYLYDLDRDALRPLTNGIDPAISPDGRMVAYTRDGGGNGLYVINSDGSGERLIYNQRELLRSPKWSPDGRWIVFSRSNGYDDCRVLRGSVCLPDEAILESLPPELQGNGQVHNLVRGLPNQRSYHTVLARIGFDGADYRDVPSLDFAGAPDWSESGIVYQSNAGIQRTADAPDTRSFEVANDPLVGYFHDPDWQAGGGRIVFHRKQGSHWQIYAVNPDGSGLVALTRPVTALVDELPSNVSPAWSPDGRYIVYLSNRNSIESAGAWHLWVMNADGSDQRRLPVDMIFDYSFSSEQMVSWGPSLP